MKPIFIAFGLAAAACNSTPSVDATDVLRVNDVIRNIDQLNGKTVRVAGYLGKCFGYDCGLFQNESDWQRAQRWFAGARSAARDRTQPPDWLGIGGFQDFDAKAKPFNESYVVITGRVSNQCRDHGKLACLDRASELDPVAISSWKPVRQVVHS